MGLDGIHHVTAISADAQRAIDFHAGVLGLRLVKTTVNFDAPDMYHLYFGDETGSPGSILTFFEIRGAEVGRAGAGMISRTVFRVPSEASRFWAERLGDAGRPVEWADGAARLLRPGGPRTGARGPRAGRRRARARPSPRASPPSTPSPASPASAPTPPRPTSPGSCSARLGFEDEGMGRFVTSGAERRGLYLLDEGPAERGIPGAGTVHHVAWTVARRGARGVGRPRPAGGRPPDAT